jgi:hypothetical protein
MEIKMNERIKQLAEQAGGEFYEGFAGSTNFVKFAENDFEKFAELIVKECVIRAEREWIRNGSDTEHNQAVSKVIGSIKQHFGVEEK